MAAVMSGRSLTEVLARCPAALRPGTQALAFHATIIGATAGLAFLALFLLLGPAIYRLLGGSGAALEQARAYSHVFFLGVPGLWLMNTAMSMLRTRYGPALSLPTTDGHELEPPNNGNVGWSANEPYTTAFVLKSR